MTDNKDRAVERGPQTANCENNANREFVEWTRARASLENKKANINAKPRNTQQSKGPNASPTMDAEFVKIRVEYYDNGAATMAVPVSTHADWEMILRCG